jgi:hypothetical protein
VSKNTPESITITFIAKGVLYYRAVRKLYYSLSFIFNGQGVQACTGGKIRKSVEFIGIIRTIHNII